MAHDLPRVPGAEGVVVRDRVQFKEVPPYRQWTPDQDPGSPGDPFWSGPMPILPVGSRVLITLNGWKIGGKPNEQGDIPGTIIGYRVDGRVEGESPGWVFAVVEADFAPLWYSKDNGRVGVFAGRELEAL